MRRSNSAENVTPEARARLRAGLRAILARPGTRRSIRRAARLRAAFAAAEIILFVVLGRAVFHAALPLWGERIPLLARVLPHDDRRLLAAMLSDPPDVRPLDGAERTEFSCLLRARLRWGQLLGTGFRDPPAALIPALDDLKDAIAHGARLGPDNMLWPVLGACVAAEEGRFRAAVETLCDARCAAFRIPAPEEPFANLLLVAETYHMGPMWGALHSIEKVAAAASCIGERARPCFDSLVRAARAATRRFREGDDPFRAPDLLRCGSMCRSAAERLSCAVPDLIAPEEAPLVRSKAAAVREMAIHALRRQGSVLPQFLPYALFAALAFSVLGALGADIILSAAGAVGGIARPRISLMSALGFVNFSRAWGGLGALMLGIVGVFIALDAGTYILAVCAAVFALFGGTSFARSARRSRATDKGARIAGPWNARLLRMSPAARGLPGWPIVLKMTAFSLIFLHFAAPGAEPLRVAKAMLVTPRTAARDRLAHEWQSTRERFARALERIDAARTAEDVAEAARAAGIPVRNEAGKDLEFFERLRERIGAELDR